MSVANAYDWRAGGAQLYGAVGEGGGVGVAAVVGEDVDIEAGDVVAHIVAYGILPGDIVEVRHSVAYAFDVELPDDEVASCPAAYDVDAGEV